MSDLQIVNNSSTIAKASWSKGVMKIAFKRPEGKVAIYAAEGVPRGLWVGLVKAKSPGRFFHEQLKQRFGFRKISY